MTHKIEGIKKKIKKEGNGRRGERDAGGNCTINYTVNCAHKQYALG